MRLLLLILLLIATITTINARCRTRAHLLHLGHRFRHYGHSYQFARYYKQNGRVHLEGLIRGHGGYIGILPHGYRPEGRLIFTVNNHQFQCRVDVLPNGQIHRVTGNHHNWISISNINFAVRGVGRARLRLGHRYRNHGGGYEGAKFYIKNGVVHVSGLIVGGGHYIGTLPRGCRPFGRLIFASNNDNHEVRLDVLANGQIHNVANQRRPWLSLSNINFVARGSKHKPRNFALDTQRFRNYGHTYAPAQVFKVNGRVYLQGLVRGNGGYLGTLPPGYRPRKRLILTVNNHQFQCRVDVLPTGRVYRITGNHHNWLSLSNINFAAKHQCRCRFGMVPFRGHCRHAARPQCRRNCPPFTSKYYKCYSPAQLRRRALKRCRHRNTFIYYSCVFDASRGIMRNKADYRHVVLLQRFLTSHHRKVCWSVGDPHIRTFRGQVLHIYPEANKRLLFSTGHGHNKITVRTNILHTKWGHRGINSAIFVRYGRGTWRVDLHNRPVSHRGLHPQRHGAHTYYFRFHIATVKLIVRPRGYIDIWIWVHGLRNCFGDCCYNGHRGSRFRDPRKVRFTVGRCFRRRGVFIKRCRPGTFFFNWRCKRCGPRSYSTKRGSLFCKKCPRGFRANRSRTGCYDPKPKPDPKEELKKKLRAKLRRLKRKKKRLQKRLKRCKLKGVPKGKDYRKFDKLGDLYEVLANAYQKKARKLTKKINALLDRRDKVLNSVDALRNRIDLIDDLIFNSSSVAKIRRLKKKKAKLRRKIAKKLARAGRMLRRANAMKRRRAFYDKQENKYDKMMRNADKVADNLYGKVRADLLKKLEQLYANKACLRHNNAIRAKIGRVNNAIDRIKDKLDSL